MNSNEDQPGLQYDSYRGRRYRTPRRQGRYRSNDNQRRQPRRSVNRDIDISDSSQWPSLVETTRPQNPTASNPPVQPEPLSPTNTRSRGRYRYDRYRGRGARHNDLSFHNFASDSREYESLKQVEYYFSVQNLESDQYLRSKMDQDGWVDINLIYRFKRIKMLNLSFDEFVNSLSNGSEIFEIDVAHHRIRPSVNPQRWYLDENNKDFVSGVGPAQMYTMYSYGMRGRYYQYPFVPYFIDYDYNQPQYSNNYPVNQNAYFNDSENNDESRVRSSNATTSVVRDSDVSVVRDSDVNDLVDDMGNMRVGQ